MSKLIDLTGCKFGRLTVVCRAGTYRRPSGTSEPTWKCVCDCGNEVVVSSSNLGKSTLSCGCLQKENRYGARRENEYEIKGDVITAVAFGGEKFIVNTCDLETIKEHRWHINNDGYITDGHGNTLHRIIMNPSNGMDVHHINGDKLDNRRCNLLMLTRSEHTSLHRNGNIANGVTVQRWIPVKNRFPCIETTALVCDAREGNIHTATFDGTLWHLDGGWLLDADDFTHWMSLPTPPKDGDSE